MYKYEGAGESDKGAVKTVNQDAFLVRRGAYNREYFIFAAVADGMGGTAEGELASRSVKAALGNWYKNDLKEAFKKCSENHEPIADYLAESWESILADISGELNAYGQAQGCEPGRGPGTTVTAVFIYGGEYYVMNIGDSRTYLIRDGHIYQITKDHSWAYEAELAGFTKEQIENDIRRNQITRCIGAGLDMAKPEYFTGGVNDGDIFLLCSDGLRRVLDNEEILSMVKGRDYKKICRTAIEEAMEKGETDNITIVLVEVQRENETEAL